MNAVAIRGQRLTIGRMASRSAAALFQHSGFAKARFQRRGGLRIICYHGVCADEIAAEPWVPEYFVPASTFAAHLDILTRFGPVVDLPEVQRRLRDGARDLGPCVAVTFDDVAACTFEHARGLLRQFAVRASFFISTGHASSGRLFDADVITLLRLHPEILSGNDRGALARLVRQPSSYKLMTLEQLQTALDEAELICRRGVEPVIKETLRPMNWDEIRTLAEAGHDIGGHTVDHAILGRQSRSTRVSQITGCLTDIERELNRRPGGFAYPNGGPDDFDSTDHEILRRCGFHYALSTRAGFCLRGTDPYSLPRVCIGMGHTPERFALEVCGLLDRRRRRQAGWR